MNPLPENPFALQARIIAALCDDISDPQAMRDANFPRLNALREVSIQSPKERPDSLTSAGGE